MKKKLFARILALVLVLTLLPCLSVPAWAETRDTTQQGTAEGNDLGSDNVEVTKSTSEQAQGVVSDSGTSLTTSGSVSATNTGGSSGGPAVAATSFANGSGTASVTVGSASASSNSTNSASNNAAIAVETYSSSPTGGANAEMTVSGDATAVTSGSGSAEGVHVIIEGDGANTSTVTVGGDVAATAASGSTGDAIGVSTVDSSKGTSTAIVNIGGNLTAESKGTGAAHGIQVGDARGTNYTEVTVDGTVEASVSNPASGAAAAGIIINPKPSDSTEIKVSANGIDVENDGSGATAGITVINPDSSTITIQNTGALDVEGDSSSFPSYGLLAYNNGKLDVTTGAITVESESSAADGIVVGYGSGETRINVQGDLTTNGNEYSDGAQISLSQDGQAYLTVDGNVESSRTGITSSFSGTDTNTLTDVEVKGDIAADVGIYVAKSNQSSYTVGGTIHGNEVGIQVGDTITTDNLEITVWQIDKKEIDGAEHVVAQKDGSTNTVTSATEAIEANINYIIKINPAQQSMISLDGTSKGGKDHKYDVAKQGDKVAMKVTVPSGYQLTGAFGDDGFNLPLKMDSNGNYYVIVPMGGGVYLSAKLSQIISSDGGNGSASGEYIDYYSYAEKLSYITITFELNEGHTLSGNPGPIIKSVPAGTWVRLIEAPYKTGSTFELWHTDDPSIKVSQPNESFCAMGDVTFTAKWVGEELPYKMTADESNLVSTLSAASMIPVIEEPVEEAPTVEEAESTTEEPESATEEATAVEDVPVSEEPASAKEATAADALPDEAVTEEAPVTAEPASESSMMIEAMTTLTAATEALQAATEALIANTAPAAVEAEAATEAPAAEEAKTAEEAGVEDAADAEISPEAAEEEQPAVEETSSSMDAAREELQRITEELDAAQSELKATSAELETAKGELKATTEELNAAKDELRATTDELVEAKDALRSAADELNAAREEFRLLLEELKAQVPASEAEGALASSPAADAAEEEAPVEEDVPTEETDTVNVDDAAEEEPSAAEGTAKS